MAPCFVTPVATSALTRSAFAPRCPAAAPSPSAAVAPSRRVRMGLGEDGLAEDIEAARSCIDEGCEVDAVQDILTRLEERRAVLQLEVTQIKDVMETLARANLGNDRGLVADAVEAALGIFAKADDNFPITGQALSYTGEKPKRKQSKM